MRKILGTKRTAKLKKIRRRIKRFFRRTDLERLLVFNYKSSVPQRQLLAGYLSYILIGTVLLLFPFSQKEPIGLVDNLFTAASALSTTGLSTVVVSESYTFWGQLIILLLIQIGGIGYMTLSSFFMYRMTRHFMSIKNRVLQAEFSIPNGFDLKSFVHTIIGFTFAFELFGAIALYFAFTRAGVADPMWPAIFHSISSFSTAGFSTFADGLIAFKLDTPINLIISILSYAGAMGFIVMTDVWRKCTRKGHCITFTTKVILFITTLITVVGSVQLYFLEPTLQQYAWYDRMQISIFQVMSAMTTVGFNTVLYDNFTVPSLLVLVMAMYIGASPSGTGGGLKSTTASAVYAFVKCKLGMQRDVSLRGHVLPSFRIEAALATFVFYTSLLFLGIYLLTITEVAIPLEKLIFEAASALGTVGLSAGISSSLTTTGKLIIVILMFIGRVGVLTFGTAMMMRMERSAKLLKEDDIAV